MQRPEIYGGIWPSRFSCVLHMNTRHTAFRRKESARGAWGYEQQACILWARIVAAVQWFIGGDIVMCVDYWTADYATSPSAPHASWHEQRVPPAVQAERFAAGSKIVSLYIQLPSILTMSLMYFRLNVILPFCESFLHWDYVCFPTFQHVQLT
jgi:hypothetical protein